MIKHVFYKGELISTNSDSESFEIINESYSKDKNNVYFINEYSHINKVEEADPTTFKEIENDFSKDKNNIYYGNSVIEDADFLSFKTLENNFSVDKNNVYHENHILKDLDPKTFEIIYYEGDIPGPHGSEYDIFYVKDKNIVYYYEGCIMECVYGSGDIENADPATFRHIEGKFFIDKNNVYLNTSKLDNADPKSFRVIYGDYSRDDNNCYEGLTIKYMSFCDGLEAEDDLGLEEAP